MQKNRIGDGQSFVTLLLRLLRFSPVREIWHWGKWRQVRAWVLLLPFQKTSKTLLQQGFEDQGAGLVPETEISQ